MLANKCFLSRFGNPLEGSNYVMTRTHPIFTVARSTFLRRRIPLIKKLFLHGNRNKLVYSPNNQFLFLLQKVPKRSVSLFEMGACSFNPLTKCHFES